MAFKTKERLEKLERNIETQRQRIDILDTRIVQLRVDVSHAFSVARTSLHGRVLEKESPE